MPTRILTLHQLHRFRPAFDDLIGSKSQRLSALVRTIEFGSIDQRTTVVALARGRDHWRLSCTGPDLLVAQTRFELDDALLLILLCQPCQAFRGSAGEGSRSQEEDASENSEDVAELKFG